MQGAAITLLQLHDLSYRAGVSTDFKAGIVVDMPWGPIDQTVQVTNKTFESWFGKTNPKKYGITGLSAKNALKGATMYVRRVDKGQLYATALLRGKLEPANYTDANGFWIDQPNVDTVIAPGKSLAHNDIDSYTFSQYPTTRVVKHFPVPVTIVKQPKADDTVIFVDNVAKVKKGDVITFKDTTGMTREDTLGWMTYSVVETGKEKVTEHWVEIQGLAQDGTALINKEVKAYKILFLDRGNKVTEVLSEAQAGTNVIQLKENTAELKEGDVVRFASHDDEYEVTNVNDTTVTLKTELKAKVEADSVIKVKVIQHVSLQAATFMESGWTADKPTLYRVNNNDILVENLRVSVDNSIGTVVRKFNIENYVNTITLSSKYIEQDIVNIGDPVWHCEEDDFEHRDCGLFYSIYPGDEANTLSVTITDSKQYKDNFIVTVYKNGNKIRGEQFEVSRKQKLNAQGQQLFIENVINNRSAYIRYIDNPDMVDANGEPVKPLTTSYYLRQPKSKAIYSQVASTVESVFDGDTKITVSPEDISNITIDKVLRINGKNYPIEALVASVQGGAVDTIQLGEQINLGMKDLPLKDRVLKVGTPVYQCIARQDKQNVTVSNVRNGVEYSVTINGVKYTITSVSSDSLGKPELRNSATGELISKTAALYLNQDQIAVKNSKVAITFNTATPSRQESEESTAGLTTFNEFKDRIAEAIEKAVAADTNIQDDTIKDFNGTVGVEALGKTVTINLNLTSAESKEAAKTLAAEKLADGVIKELALDTPSNLDVGKKYNDEASILTQLKNEISKDEHSTATADFSADGNALVLSSKQAGIPMSVEVTDYLSVAQTQKPTRERETFPVQRVDGSVLPKADKGATLEDNGEVYFILDAGANRFAGGFDDFFPTAGQYIKSLKAAFEDPSETPDLVYILQGGVNSTEYVRAINEICKKRLDVLGAIAVPFDNQAGKGVAGELKYREELALSDRYLSIYTPWVEFYDDDNDMKLWISPDSYFISLLGGNSSNGNIDKAPAGPRYGKVNSSRLYKKYDYSGDTGGEIGQLYDAQINPLRQHKEHGILIWGQKTMQVQESALDRINNNLAAVFIFKVVRKILENNTFEYNTPQTRTICKSQAESALRVLQGQGLIEGFNVICDDSNNTPDIIQNHELYLDVQYWGKYSSEKQYGRVIVTSDGSTSIAGITL